MIRHRNSLNKSGSIRSEQGGNLGKVGGEEFMADGFNHFNRYNSIIGTAQFPVIILDQADSILSL